LHHGPDLLDQRRPQHVTARPHRPRCDEGRTRMTPDDPIQDVDPLGFGEAWAKTATAALQNSEGVARAWTRYLHGLMPASAAAAARARGEEAPGPAQPGRRDRRFGDPAWEENPALFALLQGYLLSGRLVADVLDVSQVDEVTDQRMAFLADIVMDALAP